MSQNQTNLFEQATRQKLRFATPNGTLSVEDLWDLPLQHATKANLDTIAVGLNKELKEAENTESFVKPAVSSARMAANQLAFEIVKHVIVVKLQERDEAQKASDKAAQKQKLLGLLAQKEDAALQDKSADEIRAMIAAL